jgi:hypothetical protein
MACLAEGLGIRGMARGFEVDPNTVLQLHWLVEAADQLQAFSRYVLHDVHVRQMKLDELYALSSAVQDGTVVWWKRSSALTVPLIRCGSRWTRRASCC